MSSPLELEILHDPAQANGHRIPQLSDTTPAATAEQPCEGADTAVVREIREAVAARLESVPVATGSSLLAGDGVAGEHNRVEAVVAEEVGAWVGRRARAGRPPVTVAVERELARAVLAALAGLGSLQPLLDREDVENVHIHGSDRVFLELADGTLHRWPHSAAESDTALVQLLAELAARMGQTAREFTAASPMLTLRLPAGGVLGCRLAAVMAVTDRPRVAIRRYRLTHTTLADLAGMGTVDPILVEFLRAAVRAGRNIVVSGGPYAGKTTLLRGLAHEIPAGEHVITVEDDAELGLHLVGEHPVVTPMEARTANAEGAGEITLDDLLKQALRHSPSRVLVGEVRGGEVTAMLRALGNGATGGMCTLHAGSAAAVLDRIAALGQLADPPLSVDAAYAWTASAIHLVVHVRKVDLISTTGRGRRERFITEVVEVGPVGDAGRPDLTRVFTPRPGDGRAVPAFPPSPQLLGELEHAGFDRALLELTDGAWPSTWGAR